MYGFSGLPARMQQMRQMQNYPRPSFGVAGSPFGQRRMVLRKGYQGDGLFSAIGGALKKALPIASTVLGLIPGGGLIASGLKTASKVLLPAAAGAAVVGAVSRPSTALVPSLPSAVSSTPMLPAAAGAAAAAQPAGGGILPFWRGAGGKLQLPWSDPSQLFQAPYALDDSYLSIRYRAPRGYVVVRDPSGRPYAMMRGIARQVGLWRAARRPPISAGDWHKYQTAQTVEKKLRRIAGKALRKRSRSVAYKTIKVKH